MWWKNSLSCFRPLDRKEANELLNYPHNSEGRSMTPEYVDLRMDMTVAEVLERIRKTGPNRETIYICYIVYETKKLRSVASLKNIILSNPEQLIKDIMNEFVSAPLIATLLDATGLAIYFEIASRILATAAPRRPFFD